MNKHTAPVALAFVHHANQYLITQHYADRQGIEEIAAGYAAVLRLHQQYGIRANLHLSGTLLETLAWHCPWVLDLVGELRAQGLIGLIGGTYAENVMPVFDAAYNRRQLHEYFTLAQHHLGCAPADLAVCWVPERVWNTAALAPVLADPALPNGGYRYVLLDDRLLYPAGAAYHGSARARFDRHGPFAAQGNDGAADRSFYPNAVNPLKPYRVRGAHTLTMVPISAHLRYWMPPASAHDWQQLHTLFTAPRMQKHTGQLLVYADDLEKTAGVGGWDGAALQRYADLLEWIASRRDVNVEPVLLENWLQTHSPQPERDIAPGAFFELEQAWHAGTDYGGWWNNAAYAPYRHYLIDAQQTIRHAEQHGADPRLLDLAWKHVLASGYETAWHDPDGAGRAPAAWAKAIASHARHTGVIVDAARWAAEHERPLAAEVRDVDNDAEDEVVLSNDRVYAVLTPTHGGRLVFMFARTDHGGALVVGNPSDDWNLQQELNRYMDWPPNHPGAFADVHGRHDRYRVVALGTTATHSYVELLNDEPGSPLCGLRKRFVLEHNAPALLVQYELPPGVEHLVSEVCVSPDYLRILRGGPGNVHVTGGTTWRGVKHGDAAAWVALAPGEHTTWATAPELAAGHGFRLGIVAYAARFNLLIGCGATDDLACQRLFATTGAVLAPAPTEKQHAVAANA